MEEYKALLLKELVFFIGSIFLTLLVAIMVFVIVIKMAKKAPKDEKYVTYSVLCILLVLVIFLNVFCANEAIKINKDINGNRYIIYVGDYEIVPEGKSVDACYIYDDKGDLLRLQCIERMSAGNYSGRVVYSENSLFVLECIKHID